MAREICWTEELQPLRALQKAAYDSPATTSLSTSGNLTADPRVSLARNPITNKDAQFTLRRLRAKVATKITPLRVSDWPEAVIVAELTNNGWRVALGRSNNQIDIQLREQLPPTAEAWVTRFSQYLRMLQQQRSAAFTSVVVCVPAILTGPHSARPTLFGWDDIQLQALAEEIAPIPLILANSAAVCGAVEAQQVQTENPQLRSILHVDLAAHINATLVVDGKVLTLQADPSPTVKHPPFDLAHLPYGDLDVTCVCGAKGCWSAASSGVGLAHHLSHPTPTNPAKYLSDALEACFEEARDYSRSFSDDATAAYSNKTQINVHGILEISRRFSSGLAEISDALKLDAIVMAGMSAQLRRASSQSFDEAFANATHSTPALLFAQSGAEATLRGAMMLARETRRT